MRWRPGDGLSTRRRRVVVGLFATVGSLLLAVAPGAAAGTGSGRIALTRVALEQRLGAALTAVGINPATSAAMVVDLADGNIVFEQQPDLPLEPASNEKLSVTYAALEELGPQYRFQTTVLGEGQQRGQVWEGRLVLKGYGDPTLTSADLGRLADQLRSQGIRRVTGQIVGDASWFDNRPLATGWLPSFVGIDSPPLSALVVDRARDGARLVSSPPLAAAARFDQLLRSRGISARDAVAGRASRSAIALATVQSEPLTDLIEQMDHVSDNFIAEMLLKAIGAQAIGEGSTAAGAAVTRRDLQAAEVPLTGVRIVDGSGLSRSDRATARELSSLLVLLWSDPRLRQIVRASLPVAGESGTLEYRMRHGSAHGRIRAKTGTTKIASALSGFAGTRFAFALVENGHPIDADAARSAQDAFAAILAASAQASA